MIEKALGSKTLLSALQLLLTFLILAALLTIFLVTLGQERPVYTLIEINDMSFSDFIFNIIAPRLWESAKASLVLFLITFPLIVLSTLISVKRNERYPSTRS